MLTDVPRHIVVDAGPLIGLFDRSDHYHADACRGFEQLHDARASVVVPIPIVLEMYKWLTYEVSLGAAHVGLTRMRRGFEIVPLGSTALHELADLLERIPRWSGSLEDALVAMIGLRTDTPVWTINYRDLAAFPNLHFWTPA